VERICLSTAEVTNTWLLDILPTSAGGSVEAILAAEDESSLHLAISSGVYCRVDLTAEGAVSTGVHTCNLSNDEAGITSSWHWQFAKSQDKEKSGGLFLFGVSSQGRTILIFQRFNTVCFPAENFGMLHVIRDDYIIPCIPVLYL
jgi:hypothetical protein